MSLGGASLLLVIHDVREKTPPDESQSCGGS